jgi:hypothetical protein
MTAATPERTRVAVAGAAPGTTDARAESIDAATKPPVRGRYGLP